VPRRQAPHRAPAAESRIGEILKARRERSRLSLRTLARRAGFSASFLSQLENGQVSPSIGSLERIAAELNLTLSDLFEATQSVPAVVRAGRRPGFNSKWSRGRVESLIHGDINRTFDAVAVTLEPKGTSGGHSATRASDQFAYVLAGTLRLFLGDEAVELRKGDTVIVPSRIPHRWENAGRVRAQVLLLSIRLAN
jgi:transcriptional regulator with XRE-family HTH domain